MSRIAYDHQIFTMRACEGISRYFCDWRSG